MGIVNITPDSFYGASRIEGKKELLTQVEKMVHEGVNILDLGGYSSRPGADDITIEEEMNRVIPAIEAVRKQFDHMYISCDTFRSKVAQAAIDVGADMINDISGGSLDANMYKTIAKNKVPYILMHMKGSPQTMKSKADYTNLMLELIDYFQIKISALRKLGIADIIIDPGFGFAKTIKNNFEILNNMRLLETLEAPILVGISRKSMIYKSLDISPENALNGTTALNMISLMNGASILRVHDVKEAVETVKLFNLTYNIKK